MARSQYDEVGAQGGLFAPAYIHGDPVSEAAVQRWNIAHLLLLPSRPGPPAAATPAATSGIGFAPVGQSMRDAIAVARCSRRRPGRRTQRRWVRAAPGGAPSGAGAPGPAGAAQHAPGPAPGRQRPGTVSSGRLVGGGTSASHRPPSG
jgi:hypothetical protein